MTGGEHMTKAQFKIFCEFRTEFKAYCEKRNAEFKGELKPLVEAARLKDTPEYAIETPVVYNRSLDEITVDSDIRLIVIGDNPGKDEQLLKNNLYLVGQSGKIAAGFFQKNAELNTDFRKNSIILNKTPVHTAKTNHLKFLEKNGGEKIAELIAESQRFMARKTAWLHQSLLESSETGLLPELWLVGYAELKNKGIFLRYRDELKKSYTEENWEKVFVFQHFSMNRFSIDLKNFQKENEGFSLLEAIHALGKKHKVEIF